MAGPRISHTTENELRKEFVELQKKAQQLPSFILKGDYLLPKNVQDDLKRPSSSSSEESHSFERNKRGLPRSDSLQKSKREDITTLIESCIELAVKVNGADQVSLATRKIFLEAIQRITQEIVRINPTETTKVHAKSVEQILDRFVQRLPKEKMEEAHPKVSSTASVMQGMSPLVLPGKLPPKREPAQSAPTPAPRRDQVAPIPAPRRDQVAPIPAPRREKVVPVPAPRREPSPVASIRKPLPPTPVKPKPLPVLPQRAVNPEPENAAGAEKPVNKPLPTPPARPRK